MFSWFKSRVTENFLKVDIHSHLLPGIDDGVQTFEDSMKIIKEFESLGFDKLITTPHIINEYYPNTPEIISKKLSELKKELKKNSIEIKIEAAAEYFVDEHFMKNINAEEKLCEFGDNYILIETGFMNKPLFLNEAIFKLQSKGYKPVLAHPERYVYFQEDYDAIESLGSTGLLLQINALSLTGYYSRQAQLLAEHLITKNMVQLIGSDVHNAQQMNQYKKVMNSKKFQRTRQLDLLNSSL